MKARSILRAPWKYNTWLPRNSTRVREDMDGAAIFFVIIGDLLDSRCQEERVMKIGIHKELQHKKTMDKEVEFAIWFFTYFMEEQCSFQGE